MVRRSEKYLELAKKKLAIQMVIETAKKKADNPFFNSKYADLKEVMTAIKTAMEQAKTFLLIEQYPNTDFEKQAVRPCVLKNKGNVIAQYEAPVPLVTITTRITDIDSGEYEESDISGYPSDDTAQGLGSLETYLRRYGIMPVFNITPEEDDGNAASGKDPAQPETAQGSQRTQRSTQGGSRPRSEQKGPSAPQQAQNSSKADEKKPDGENKPLFDDAGNPIDENGNIFDDAPDGGKPEEKTGNGTRPMSNAERARVGLINGEQFDKLKALLSSKKVPGKVWKQWLMDSYNFDSASAITTETYAGIYDTVDKNTSIILNYKGKA